MRAYEYEITLRVVHHDEEQELNIVALGQGIVSLAMKDTDVSMDREITVKSARLVRRLV